MGLVVRPLADEDRKETIDVVRHTITSSTVGVVKSVESPSIFSGTRTKIDLQQISIYNRRARIEFPIPVLNFFLAGDKGELLGKVLNKNLDAIITGRIVYSKSANKTISTDNLSAGSMTYTNDILLGGAYIRYLIDHLDVEKEIEDILKETVVSCLPRSVKKEVSETKFNVGYIQKGSGAYWVLDEYYFNPTIVMDEYAEDFKEKLDIKRRELVNLHMSRVVLLLSMRGDNKKKVRDMVQDFMIVMPLGYRPTIDRRRDPITKAYNKVVKCNNDLITVVKYSHADMSSVITCYKELMFAVKNLTVKTTSAYDKANTPILETLKGKTGHIRDKMHGSRSDYTGRAVIVVDPKMPFDTVGIPANMAEKLMELHVIKEYKTESGNKRDILKLDKKKLRCAMAAQLLEGEYVISGRQPTLYYLGIQAFKVKIVSGNAIVLNPLSTPAFNADFDGDQMHCTVPYTKEAKREVKHLMSSTNNLFMPRTGDLHTGPRQEILYGLWKASKVKPNEKSQYYNMDKTTDIYSKVFAQVCSQEINAYDVINVDGKEMTAGIVAIKACLGKLYRNYIIGAVPLTEDNTDKAEDGIVTSEWLKALLQDVAIKNKSKFVAMINSMVHLGFAIAEYYPPNISVLDYPDVSSLLDEFDERIKNREEWYNRGFETEESFSSFYNKEYTVLETKIKAELKSKLGENNGYLDMVESGARGSMSNIVQLFGMKGQIAKNNNEAFNAIIRHPMAYQLSGLEHFITAYGARKGMRDKVIETYEPGYLYRQMSHTTACMTITEQDCRTTNGILIDYDFAKQFIPYEQFKQDDDEHNNKLVKGFITKLLIGRFIVGFDLEIHSKDVANDIYDSMIANIENGKLVRKAGIKLRSPITCNNPCCVKCYGKDLGTNAMAVEGQPIGFIAAQAIGEPGTQLTMKNFQNGGVAGVSNLTSSFSLLNKYINLSTFSPEKADDPITYDYIAPVEGWVETVTRGDGTKVLKIMNYDKQGLYKNRLGVRKVVLYEGVKLKEYVKKGDSIQLIQGDLSIKEIMANRSPEEAQRYLTLRLYNIFLCEVEVNLKHFEVLVASLTYYICTKGNNYFKTGCFYTVQEYHSHSREGCEFEKTMVGAKYATGYRSDLCAAIFMENIRSNMQRAIMLSGYDSLTNPIVRSMFGLSLGIGSDVPSYIERRGRV